MEGLVYLQDASFQAQKEMLVVVYGLKKFHHYSHGRKMNVVTDHRPLVLIYVKHLKEVPKWLQDLLTSVQQWLYHIVWARNGVPWLDVLSQEPTSRSENEELLSVNNKIKPIQDWTQMQIHWKTEGLIMIVLSIVIARGWPDDKRLLSDSFKLFFDYRSELTTLGGLILWG